MKKNNSVLIQCICFFTVIMMMGFLSAGSAYAFRNHQGGKGGNGPSHSSPRYEPQHRPDYRPSSYNHRPPAYHHRPPAYYHRPPAYHHRPPAYYHRPPAYYHGHHYSRFSIGMGANFFWPWFGYYPWWGAGSAFVSPGVGTVLISLPLGCSRISVGGTVYYHNDGIYYKEVPSGYVITEPPVAQNIPVVKPPSSPGAQISVTTQVLNVRSGPGFHYPVILQVVLGDSLTLRGESDGWSYVQTAGGESGWVVTRFTTKWSG